MDQSYSESDVSLSPSQLLERIQMLRQLHLMQRGKLQKQRLEYQESSEISSSITEIVSHFSNTTSYNTFRSLLQSSQDLSTDATPRTATSHISRKDNIQDAIEGVSVLNLSQESEFVDNSPLSSQSRLSNPSKSEANSRHSIQDIMSPGTKQISLDEMPILSPKKDFESLIAEKLKKEENMSNKKVTNKKVTSKKPFLKRGEGMARFGLRKNDLVIQNTKSLPWKSKDKSVSMIKKAKKTKKNEKTKVQIVVSQPDPLSPLDKQTLPALKIDVGLQLAKNKKEEKDINLVTTQIIRSNCNIHTESKQKYENKMPLKGKHPLLIDKGKTWAAVLTKEQDDFLRQLKQSDYYKNFVSPVNSIVADASCDEQLSKLRQERETAEQNMFELIENKVCEESFDLENSFFNRFLRKNLDGSGESTPLVMQKCLTENPGLLHIFPDLKNKKRIDSTHSDAETCNSDYTECSEACSVSSCCSCRTIDQSNSIQVCKQPNLSTKQNQRVAINEDKSKENKNNNDNAHDNTVTNNDNMNTNMAEMNSKLVATSELLKERLKELEDEIETFRKENANLTKMREEIDVERQKFYEEKSSFEQKFNEEKILSEYYLAEEKEKLSKQKQIYERYVRDMRGRLNKKEKDEVINFKKEISDLKEEIRLKDAKSTSTIAKLRNQIKIMEKEKKTFQDEIEKLKKENRRIQHSNDITRRLTNLKYLEQINKKLTHITARDSQSEVDLDANSKYKAFEIERQSRSRKVEPTNKAAHRPRAKSVPNLKVTSRYAKYFSQRDSMSEMEKHKMTSYDNIALHSDNEEIPDPEERNKSPDDLDDTYTEQDNGSDDENLLEKIYNERFQSTSLTNSNRPNGSNDVENNNDFFIQKSNSNRHSKSSSKSSLSPHQNNSSGSNFNMSESPASVLSYHSNSHRTATESYNNIQGHFRSSSNLEASQNKAKSPTSILSSHSSSDARSTTVINKHFYADPRLFPSPEPTVSKSSLTKTTMNPTETRKPDGTRELRFPNGNVKFISADGKYSKFVYYNGDIKEHFYDEGRVKYFYAETKTYHTTHADGLEVLEFSDGQVEKRYKDGSSEIRLPNGSIRYFDPKNEHVREEWRFPDGASLTVSAAGEQRIVFSNGQIEVHTKDHKRREFPDGTVKLVYNDGTSETRYSSGRVRIKDKHGNLIMDSAPR